MLRIILWRLSFELLSFLKFLGFKGKTGFYFAYGANLDPVVLKKRRIHYKSKEVVLLKGYKLHFNHEIPFEGMASASIEEASPNESVPGVLYELHKIDEWRMDCFEASWIFGRYLKVRSHLNGKDFYFYRSGRSLAGLKPSRIYLNKILNGYRLLTEVDPAYLKALEETPALDEMIPMKIPRFLVLNYECFGKTLAPLLHAYDRLCMKVFLFFIFRPAIFDRFN
jgi:hypothetical protein